MIYHTTICFEVSGWEDNDGPYTAEEPQGTLKVTPKGRLIKDGSHCYG